MWYEPALPVHLSPAVVLGVRPRVQTASVSSPAIGGSNAAAAVPGSPAVAGPSSSELEQSPSQSVEKDSGPGPSDECGRPSSR